MADRLGVESVGGLSFSSTVTAKTWPPSPVAVTAPLPILRQSLMPSPQIDPQDRAVPTTGQDPGHQRAVVSAGNIDLRATYNGIEAVWAMVLGRMPYSIGGIVQPEEITPGAYRHTYEVDPLHRSHAWTVSDGVQVDSGVLLDQQLLQHGTFAMDYGSVVWEANGIVFPQLAIVSRPREVSIRLSAIAHRIDLDSVVNTDLSGLFLAWEELTHFDLTLRVGGQSTMTPLSASDDILVDSLEIGITQGLSTTQRADSGLYMGEPRRVGLPQIRGRIRNPRYSDETQIDRSIASESLMMSAVWTGPEIGATGENYELGIYMPHVELISPQIPVAGPTMVTESYGIIASVPGDDYAGIPSTVNRTPIIVQVVSDESTNPFY